MHTVTFQPSGISARVSDGTTILDAARGAGIIIESPCSGEGTCGKCRVKVPTDADIRIKKGNSPIAEKLKKSGYVLSCGAEINGDLVVEIPEISGKRDLKIVSHGKPFNSGLDSFIKKKYIEEEDRTYIYAGDNLIGSDIGDSSDKLFGLAVDIGTTTLVVSLVDLVTGIEIDSVSTLNPQALIAQDVLSRIKFASSDEGLLKMNEILISELNRMITVLTDTNIIEKEYIYEAVLSGNTCMLHLAVNENPASLGKYPYTPAIAGGYELRPTEHGLELSSAGHVYIPSIISAFVGGDITSGILVSGLKERPGKTLFVDIGTNGEIVLAVNGEMYATSTAAGPAFEGMNITSGMRAENGAIEYFRINENGEVAIDVIGGSEAVGICGSGLIDIVSELVRCRLVNSSGRFLNGDDESAHADLRSRFIEHDGKRAFKISEKVFITQNDIRQVQLAKGSIRAGIELLLERTGYKAGDVENVLIAGSFGFHLKPESLVGIGLLPAEFSGKIEFLGNTSKTGGQSFLVNCRHRESMEQIVKDIKVIELSECDNFQKVFTRSLGF